jgi:hypothetical protein
MKQKLLLGFLLLFSFSSVTFAQTLNNEPNALHNKLYGILSKSFEVQLPEKVQSALKAHALQNNLDIKIVMRSALRLKPVYNESLPTDDRLFYANHALTTIGKTDFTLPVFLFQEVIDKLKPKK